MFLKTSNWRKKISQKEHYSEYFFLCKLFWVGSDEERTVEPRQTAPFPPYQQRKQSILEVHKLLESNAKIILLYTLHYTYSNFFLTATDDV